MHPPQRVLVEAIESMAWFYDLNFRNKATAGWNKIHTKGRYSMKNGQRTSLIVIMVALLSLFLTTVYAQTAKKSYTFHGKVEKVDAAEKKLTVNGEKVEGWMAAMTMTYAVDKEDVLKKLKVGDQITAKVYDGDFMVLHDVQIVPAAKAPATPAKD
jgi:Cu/Ag efflux protein CusF